MAKDTCSYGKEAYSYGKRSLFTWKKRPVPVHMKTIHMIIRPIQITKEAYSHLKRAQLAIAHLHTKEAYSYRKKRPIHTAKRPVHMAKEPN